MVAGGYRFGCGCNAGKTMFSEMQLRLSAIQLPSDAVFIRGYNETIDFSFALTNLESTLRVDTALTGTSNYDVTVTTAHPAARKRRDVGADPATTVAQLATISDDQLGQSIDYSSNIVISGQVTIIRRCILSCAARSTIPSCKT